MLHAHDSSLDDEPRRSARATRSLALGAFLGLAALTSCHPHSRSDHYDDPVEYVDVYREVEPNDSELNANYFGLLAPGDFFYIDGYCSSTDLDGFAFTASQPIHVDFRLFVESPYPDLDVCLFDPQFGEIVACFETANDPEQGGVDVTAGGLDFHLLVESYVGSGPYSLEISVSPLYAREAQASEAGGAVRASAPPTTLEAQARESDPDAFSTYAQPRMAVAPTVRTVTYTIDPETGERMEVVVEEPLTDPVAPTARGAAPEPVEQRPRR